METSYEISLNMKTARGIETYGCFAVGSDEDFAKYLYGLLEGSGQVSPNTVITIDLIKRRDGIIYPMDLRHCSYDQLAVNVKLITKELFKQLNL